MSEFYSEIYSFTFALKKKTQLISKIQARTNT